MEEKIIEITEQELELEDYISMRVAVRDYDGSLIKNDSVLVFVSDSALDEWADQNHFYETDTLPIRIMDFGEAVNYAAENKASRLFIAGFYDELSSLSGKELKAAGELAFKYCVLKNASKSEEAAKKAAKKLRDKEFFIHGILPADMKKGDSFGTESIKRSDGKSEWSATPLFLNRRSAEKQNPNDAPVNACRLCDTAFLYRTMFKIFVEPYESYGFEFEPDDIL